MKKVILILFLFLLTGCWNIQSWKYTSEERNYSLSKINKTVVIPPFRDIRENKNNMNTMALAWIPLVPYSKMIEANTPEGLPNLMANMGLANETLAKTTAEELSNANLFNKAHFNFDTKNNDFILEGTLKEFKIERYWTFYGLSLPGDLLWLLGLPAGTEYNTISIQYRLINQSGKEFFKKEYIQKENWIQGLYYGLENYRFEKLMKKINMELIEDLNQVIPKLK